MQLTRKCRRLNRIKIHLLGAALAGCPSPVTLIVRLRSPPTSPSAFFSLCSPPKCIKACETDPYRAISLPWIPNHHHPHPHLPRTVLSSSTFGAIPLTRRNTDNPGIDEGISSSCVDAVAPPKDKDFDRE
ncbi:hypothetical protein B0H16DRAFT_536271 [Mycena metata]|uniref:Uncharacterized protein n=1 Tax=Mycena metata TaxID=1033252 RepID=A0AAD7H7W8_9AGAR|nr:hypothetical protein B0H16DRAFT_536271 [Mycena metata]